MSVSCVLCCQVAASAIGRSLVQRSHTEYEFLSLSMIRRSNNPLNLKCVGGKRSVVEENNHEEECQTNRTMFKRTVRFAT